MPTLPTRFHRQTDLWQTAGRRGGLAGSEALYLAPDWSQPWPPKRHMIGKAVDSWADIMLGVFLKTIKLPAFASFNYQFVADEILAMVFPMSCSHPFVAGFIAWFSGCTEFCQRSADH